jgi:Ca2+-binding RTX toxin-like protein
VLALTGTFGRNLARARQPQGHRRRFVVRTLFIHPALVRVGACAALVLAAMVAATPSASAATCSVDVAGKATVMAADQQNEVRLRANGANLEASGVPCGALNAIESVIVNVVNSQSAQVAFDLSGGPLGPGKTNENDGSSEIEFSVTGNSNNGTLAVIGSSGNDGLAVGQEQINGNLTGLINLNATADGATPDVDVSFGVLPFLVSVDGGAGNDVITGAGVTVTSSAFGQVLKLTGGSGSNVLTGGTNSDEINIRTELVSTGHDTVSSGGGFDRVLVATDSPGLTSSFSLDGVANDGVGCPGVACEGDNIGADIWQITGSAASETLIGNENTNVLIGGGGQDVLKGLGGLDNLECSGGKLFGGAADDQLTVNPGCAVVSGGTGLDTASYLFASAGVTVTLDGLKNDGSAKPFANVRADVEDVVGSNFGDTIVGSSNGNLLQGGSGRDDLSGGNGNDRLEGGNGNDTLNGGPDNDRLIGGAGDDTLDGGDGIDLCGQGPGTGTKVNCE